MKKIISMLLVLAMMITVLTVGITTTTAAETATITIYGLDGTTEVKEINVGEEFTVYSTLNVSASVADGMVSSVQGTQTYTSDVLSLVDEVYGQYGEFEDLVKVFPITADATTANGAQAGKIVYNASTPQINNGFKFDSDSSQLIVTTYKVTKAGNAEVKNALKNLAAADADLTKLVFEGKVQEGKTIAGKATFTDPTPTIDHAEVRIHNLDGTVETQSFNIGDTFNVYTTLDASSVNSGLMSSVNGTQRYTTSVLSLADTVDADGLISDNAKVFPVMGNSAMGSVKTAGTVKYAGSSANGFLFNSLNSQLLCTTYRVTANGYADITNKLNVLAAADDDITRIVFNGETLAGQTYAMRGSFNTDGPIPTLPPTQPPTEPSDKLKVTIVNPDNTTSVKEFNKGDTFTVYTVLNAGATIASVEGTQTYPTATLQLTDSVTGEYNEIVNKTAMFPILGDEAFAAVNNGVIQFNASRGKIGGGYAFNTATSKLIVTNYKVLATGEATIKTTLRTLIKDNAAATKIVYDNATQSGQSYAMPGTFTDPGAPVIPTEAPTEPPVKPTEPQPDNKATVTIIGIDGTSKVKTFNVGDEFTVYTTFNSSSAAPNGIASIDATQSFTKGILQSTDEVDSLFVVTDSESMFPILGAGTVAKIDPELATNKFNASTPQISKGFKFETDDSLLAVTHYKVAAAGNAEVKTSLNMLSAADENLTVIVRKGVIQPGFTLGGYSSFYEPGKPEPTEPPTEAPTEPQPGQTANVTIYGIDGTSQVKTFNVGESFTVYTTLNAASAAPSGVASISASQTFTKSILQSTDAVDELKVVTDNVTMFPILGNAAVAKIDDGLNKFNASTPQINKGFKFDNDNALLAVTHYTVTAAGNAEIRTTLDMMGAADSNLSVIVKNGELQPGFNPLGGIASFTDPGTTQPTEAPVEYYLLGDADNNDLIDIVDSSQIQRYMADFDFDPAFDLDILRRNGDVDFSGYIEITDATYIQRSLADFEVEYPIGSYIPIQ
ncbi:hypothetical protein [Ruminococcus sp.]|uniref:hypothetical protein n=1 Tax=Ruminococcus sp. TaxID=41978 RepID=UPI003865464C